MIRTLFQEHIYSDTFMNRLLRNASGLRCTVRICEISLPSTVYAPATYVPPPYLRGQGDSDGSCRTNLGCRSVLPANSSSAVLAGHLSRY